MNPQIIRVVVTSKNPIKIEAARRGFERAFPDAQVQIRSEAVPSGVADQPKTDAETLRGARQRAETAKERYPDADFWIGLEGGLEIHDGELFAGAWIYILGTRSHGRSRTANFLLPPTLIELLDQGLELGQAIDQVFDRQGAKRGPGAAGLLTDDVIRRADLYEPAVILALAPLKKERLYADS